MKKKKPVYEGKMMLRKDDEVVVLSGKDKGKRGKVRQAIPEEGKVVIDGVNIVTKHRKPRSTSQRAMVKQQLGEMQVPMGLSVAKVALVCPKCHTETRVGSARGEDGAILRTAKKAVVRVCRECGEMVDD